MASGHRRVPHPKAGHMAAPTSDSALGQQSSCQHGAVHTWPKAVIGNRRPPQLGQPAKPPRFHSVEGRAAPTSRHKSSNLSGRLKAGVQKHVTAHLLVAAITPGTKSFTSGAILPK